MWSLKAWGQGSGAPAYRQVVQPRWHKRSQKHSCLRPHFPRSARSSSSSSFYSLRAVLGGELLRDGHPRQLLRADRTAYVCIGNFRNSIANVFNSSTSIHFFYICSITKPKNLHVPDERFRVRRLKGFGNHVGRCLKTDPRKFLTPEGVELDALGGAERSELSGGRAYEENVELWEAPHWHRPRRGR